MNIIKLICKYTTSAKGSCYSLVNILSNILIYQQCHLSELKIWHSLIIVKNGSAYILQFRKV